MTLYDSRNFGTPLRGAAAAQCAGVVGGDMILFVRHLEESFVIFTIAPDGKRLKRLTGPGSDDSHATNVVARRRVDRLVVSTDGIQRSSTE